MKRLREALAATCCASILSACLADEPAALHPPAGQQPFLRLHATGVQIYACEAKAGTASGWAWTFKSPEATMTDDTGRVVLHHFAGPSWAADDGSKIVGHVAASVPSPQAGSIPWLRLDVASREGNGLFDRDDERAAAGYRWRCGARDGLRERERGRSRADALHRDV